MVIKYVKNELPIFNQYVDLLAGRGKRFFLTTRIKNQLNFIPPSQFHVFDDKEAYVKANSAYPEVRDLFNVKAKHDKYFTDVTWLLECGYCIATCEDIPPQDILAGKAFAMTSNCQLLNRFLRDAKQREKFEGIVDRCGLEHLAGVRRVNYDGTLDDIVQE